MKANKKSQAGCLAFKDRNFDQFKIDQKNPTIFYLV